MLIQNHWYVGCASAELKSEPYPARIGEQKIALFRDSSGRAHALLDRCCHRGYPLSLGKIEGNALACGFHGWQYDGQGQCVKIPSQTAEQTIPKSHCVKSFSCEEKDGYVWVWIGESAPGPLPAIPEYPQEKGGKWIQGSRVIACHYLRALEITYDAAHLYFVHPTHPATIAAKKYGFAPGGGEIRPTATGCMMFLPPSESDENPLPTSMFGMEFHLPGRIRFSFRNHGYMYFFTQPIDDKTCRMDWLLVNQGAAADAPHVIWSGEGKEIIEEDQIVLELIEKTYQAEGNAFERSVEADIPTLTLRKIVKLAEKNEWSANQTVIPKRRTYQSMGPAGYDGA